MSTSSNTHTLRKYGDVTGLEKLQFRFTVLKLPFVLLWTVLVKPFVAINRHKSLKRTITDTTARFLLKSVNRVQLQYLAGQSSRKTYEKWVHSNGFPSIVEDVGEDAHLMWIGPKRTDKVILWLHGGAFLTPPTEPALSFWRYSQEKLKERDQDVGYAMLSYTLIPNASFPTPLRQACKAIEHLLASGVKPENLQLVGDSAGGSIIIQLLSHVLHPLDDVPVLHLPSPIRGAYLMSPWTRLIVPVGNEFDGIDIITSKTVRAWGEENIAGVPESKLVYLEPATVSETWFKGVSSVVSRVLITVGGVEVMKADVESFNDLFSRHHEETEYLVQEDGVHDDPIQDFALGGKNPTVGDLTPLIINWLHDGFQK